jgi:hypothetical protein
MNKPLAIGAAILGLLFVGLAAMYWTVPAASLPSFMPGFDAGSTAVHFKHGLGSVILAAGLFAYAWFQSGSKKA